MDSSREILVFPRSLLATSAPFIPWPLAQHSFDLIQQSMDWLVRDEAEVSTDLLQPIPCSIIRNENGEYCALRRIREGRDDLKSKVTLVVGGHIDRGHEKSGFESLLVATLKREVKEELGVEAVSEIRPIGVVMDHSSDYASRHVGFVYETVISQEFKPRAPEEFSTESIVGSKLYTTTELSKFREEFDPWSFIIFAEHISTSYTPADLGSQPALFSMNQLTNKRPPHDA